MDMIDIDLKGSLISPMSDASAIEGALLALSHELGRDDRGLALLGEGNTSARLSADVFLVKASGAKLATLSRETLAACRFDRLTPLLGSRNLTDEAVDAALLASRVDPASKKPSVEAIFHAYLLTLPGVEFVGHTHPICVNQLLCSRFGRTFARRRMFPDEIVCCGMESVFVPYTDPGLKLAQAIRRTVEAYVRRLSRPPRVILLENHGFVALGPTPEAVLSATLMGEKAARVFAGAAAAAGAPRFLSPAQVVRIAGRPDEHYRQKALGI
jgi:rhamnose utilization protein RhaD (predicted bifunctional aldolase and dehydrogenase)